MREAALISKKEQIRQELEAIQEANADKLLVAKEVVEWAKVHPESAMHAEFPWDLETAAYQRWIDIARNLIRIHITIIDGATKPTRQWVSIATDRARKGGGYRSIISVMSHADERGQLLKQALYELSRWREKYATLQELAELFVKIDEMPKPPKSATA